MKADAIVLGAGIVGVCVAIHLAQRGRSVVLVDRRQPGEETSYGNAGLIQREGVLPHEFPQEFAKLLKYSRNDSTAMSYHPSALPRIAAFLAQYWWNSRPARYEQIVRQYEPLIAHSISEHAALIEAAGAEALIAKDGWYLLFRTDQARDAAFEQAAWTEAQFGVHHSKLGGDDVAALEPALLQRLSGALHWTDPWTIRDPKALTLSYVALLERLGGVFRTGNATTFVASPSGQGWQVETNNGPVEAPDAVVALGPWSDLVTQRLGYRLPLAVKRGYHMHYRPVEGHELRHWALDAETGYLLAPMNQGIRLTTGAEFALRDSPPTPIQVDRAEATARQLLPLGERLDPVPWMGARPCTPDMMPIIGPAPRHRHLWFALGHAHHGMTLGPATGRLIADLVVGAEPFIRPDAFSATRFTG